jgi:hypothetical protein
VLSGLGGPMTAFGILLLLLPRCKRSALVWAIATFATLSVIASFAFNFVPALSQGRSPGILLIAEIVGTLIGAALAFLCLRFKAIDPLG